MPFVNVLITDEGATDDQKAEIISQITKTLQTTLGKNPETTHIVIQEIPAASWGLGGLPTPQYRARQRGG